MKIIVDSGVKLGRLCLTLLGQVALGLRHRTAGTNPRDVVVNVGDDVVSAVAVLETNLDLGSNGVVHGGELRVQPLFDKTIKNDNSHRRKNIKFGVKFSEIDAN